MKNYSYLIFGCKVTLYFGKNKRFDNFFAIKVEKSNFFAVLIAESYFLGVI